MTAVRDRAVDDALPPGDRPSKTRRSGIAIPVVGLVVVAAAAAVLAWCLTAASARSAVVILTDQHSLTCSPSTAVTTTVTAVADDSEASLSIPAIRLSGPTSCKMTFILDNTGTSPVTINAVHLAPMLPITGLHTGAVGEVGTTNSPVQLGPHEAVSVDIGLAWQHGCLASDGTDTASETPTLSITADGLNGTINRPGPSYAVLGTRASETHCPWKH